MTCYSPNENRRDQKTLNFNSPYHEVSGTAMGG